MPYLIPNDYKKQIQSDNLNQVIGSDLSIQLAAELAAIAEAKSYLVQKYDTAQEFTDTMPWSPTTTYKAKSRVVLDSAAYSATSIYPLNSLAIYQGKAYICTTAINTGEAFNPSHWTLLGNQYDLFYAALPYPEFVYTHYYALNYRVYWKGKTYICQRPTVTTSHEVALQLGQVQNIPLQNVFPDDPTYGVLYWGTGVAYSVPAGTMPTDATKWTAGDNRDQQMVTYVIDLVLYHVHSRIAPRNIPDLRVKRYDDARAWFKACAKGDVTPALPLLQPKQGMRIRYGGAVKNNNTY